MGNCIYKIQIDQQAQSHNQIDQNIVEQAIKDEVIQPPPLIEPKKIYTQNYEIIQESSDTLNLQIFKQLYLMFYWNKLVFLQF